MKTDEVIFYPSAEFRLGDFGGIPVLYYGSYNHYRDNTTNFLFEQFGLHKYYLRHGDNDWSLPVSVEDKFVLVNYCGCIFSPVDIAELVVDKFFNTPISKWKADRKTFAKIRIEEYPYLNGVRKCLSLDEETAYDIISDENRTIMFHEFFRTIGEGEMTMKLTSEDDYNFKIIKDGTEIGKLKIDNLYPEPLLDRFAPEDANTVEKLLDGKTLYIDGLQIYEAHRGTGLFKEVQTKIEEFARSKSCDRLVLTPYPIFEKANISNVQSLRDMYMKFGYETVYEIKPNTNMIFYIMIKNIGVE